MWSDNDIKVVIAHTRSVGEDKMTPMTDPYTHVQSLTKMGAAHVASHTTRLLNGDEILIQTCRNFHSRELQNCSPSLSTGATAKDDTCSTAPHLSVHVYRDIPPGFSPQPRASVAEQPALHLIEDEKMR